MFLYIKTILVLHLFYENVSGTCLGTNGSTTNIVGTFGVISGPLYCPNYPMNQRCLFIPRLFSTNAPPNYVYLRYNTSNMYNLTFTFDYSVDNDYVSIAYTNIYYNCSAGFSLGYKISPGNNNSLAMPIYNGFGFDLPEICDNKLEILIAFEHYANTDINFDEACVEDNEINTVTDTRPPSLATSMPSMRPTFSPFVKDPNNICYSVNDVSGLTGFFGSDTGTFCPNYPDRQTCLGIVNNAQIIGRYDMSNKYNISFDIDYELDFAYAALDKTEIFYNCNGTTNLGLTISPLISNAILNVAYKNIGFELPSICDNNNNITITIKQTATVSTIIFNFDEMCIRGDDKMPTASPSMLPTSSPSVSPSVSPVTTTNNQSDVSRFNGIHWAILSIFVAYFIGL